MAIGFARLEFVQRSSGKTACGKAAYVARGVVQFDGTKFAEPQIFNWSFQEKPAYQEVCLPPYVDPTFKALNVLWNAVEQKENRHNSQVQMELVLALPDDEVISLEDKIELIKTFVDEHFIKKGLAAQIAIHPPEKKIQFSAQNEEMENRDHNWHAHVLLPTRRFKENGCELEDTKARDLVPVIRNGKVIAGPNWGKLWSSHQNLFFEEKGLDLRVDESGIISQKHLGPIRMRGRAFALEEENQTLAGLNTLECKKREKILNKLLETRHVFGVEDVERFLQKHVASEDYEEVFTAFWKQDCILQLLDKKTGELLNKYTTQEVLDEEKQILRLGDALHQLPAFKLKLEGLNAGLGGLSAEQKRAFDKIVRGNRVECIEGHAGTGKSYLLFALCQAYEQNGYKVRAFGPDNATAEVLKSKGFHLSENVFRFLFSLHHKKVEITKGKEVWIVDEAAKLGNRPLLELLKAARNQQAQLVFSGCSSQFSSVERGGWFKSFCERYGAEELIEIQRQKTQQQRDMAKNLAIGKIGVAIDQLTRMGGIRWQETKEEAIEGLIKQWAVDQTSFPMSSSLILAHSNSEVRILNEMARLYRQEKGELEESEYVCKTAYGKIIVSVGDKVEFRKKDAEIGVINGMRGTLIAASPNQFIVAIQSEEGSRRVTFDPTHYTSFQLGYATTYFRSQGQTVERAYVLHSPQMSKEKFYVGLTRHVQRAYLYASKTDANGIADLKRQASRNTLRETTLNYETQEELYQRQTITQRNQEIKCLKESQSVLEKMKGHTLSTWDHLKLSLTERLQSSQDLRESRSFFQPEMKEGHERGQVVKIQDNHLNYEQDRYRTMQKAFSSILDKFQPPSIQSRTEQIEKTNAWDNLSQSNKALLKEYYLALNQASNLYSIVKSESRENLKGASHFNEWQTVCATRNKCALGLIKSAPRAFLQEALGKDAYQHLEERASKHEGILNRQNNKQSDLIEQLKTDIDSLVYRLFPEGPTGRDHKGLRFGSKGALSVICQGEETGCYYDFGNSVGGGPLQLVQHVLGLSSVESQKWAEEFLGQSKEIKVPSHFNYKQYTQDASEWKSLKADPNHLAPTLKDLSVKLNEQFNEVARHPYRDEKGDLLFYTLRLVDKNDSTKKIVLPLSYGQWNGSNALTWSLKAYQSTQRPIYNLDLLNQRPNAVVLVVEGEKTADAAQKMLSDKNIICVTWLGGSSAVCKTDWSPLYGRDVVIWPDNDQSGFNAAETICTELRKIGMRSLSLVDPVILAEEFPKKWDLADQLPSKKTSQDMHELILMAKEKTVGIESLFSIVNSVEKDTGLSKFHAKDVLFRVEERVWRSLEEQHGSRIWEIKQAVISETHQLLAQQEELGKDLQKNHCLSPELAGRLSRQLALYQASKGEAPSGDKVEELKRMMTNSNLILAKDGNSSDICQNRNFSEYIIERSITDAFCLGLNKTPLSTGLHFSKERFDGYQPADEIMKQRNQELYL